MAIHSQLGEKVAIKILEKDKIRTRGDTERVTREVKILKQVYHPHIIQLYEIIETQKQVLLVMELAEGGELFNYIVSKHRLNEQEACKYLNQILSALEYLQKIRVVHRDLKPENLLLDNKKNIKMVDFGLSNLYQNGETLKTACGSPCYAAPEMIAGKRYHGAQVDVWSSGVILYAMLCGYLPFEDSNTSNLYKKILSGDFKLPTWLSPEAVDILRKILVTDPEKRYTIEKIRSHPWFLKYTSPHDIYQVEKFETNEQILACLSSLGYNCMQIKEYLAGNKHNSGTAVYKIIVHMQKMGKKIPEMIKLKRPQLHTDSSYENKISDRPHTRTKTYGNSVSPGSYRPVTSYAIPTSLLPISLAQRHFRRPSPRVKTPLNNILDITNTLNMTMRNKSPRLGTALEIRRPRDFS
ncbi:hypothetical protein SteCoe_27778 [Stentor coeruleus]|uniref:Protein kinase domain-containing protein n=1 Tax=Stentor coeruleus TaxID=5963 RepID=A0A1R2B9U3_9CILI|nr:hypothetical protein SteCoe_27778 [Stentor coeruleus]